MSPVKPEDVCRWQKPNQIAGLAAVSSGKAGVVDRGAMLVGRAILLRLATNTRMKTVSQELSRRGRSGGRFFHPANRRLIKPEQTRDDVQADALGECSVSRSERPAIDIRERDNKFVRARRDSASGTPNRD